MAVITIYYGDNKPVYSLFFTTPKDDISNNYGIFYRQFQC
ncbi:hypothetical protein A464_3331 [Salmonella bongori N268-08]|uniref:Uncharacterized protein n=1 Tax=Salmonella bongori N268-08 TaxID=1197719 RepID=S5NCW9_SALBN|nr:hypothetical protein A464_3331 [Salmonella bongori N268-08]